MIKTPMLILSAFTSLTLASCDERENPLTRVEESRVVSWLLNREQPLVDRMVTCGAFWADESGSDVPPDSRDDCNALTEHLATDMTAAGFGEVTIHDIHLPTIWAEFISRKSRNTYDPKKAADTIK